MSIYFIYIHTYESEILALYIVYLYMKYIYNISQINTSNMYIIVYRLKYRGKHMHTVVHIHSHISIFNVNAVRGVRV